MASITVEDNNGGIRIRVQVEGKRYSFSPIPRAKYSNRQQRNQAELIAHHIQIDLDSGCFDTSLERYKTFKEGPLLKDSPAVKEPTPQPTLMELWAPFLLYKANTGIADSTLRVDYIKRVEPTLNQLPTLELSDSLVIRDWVLENRAPLQARKILLRVNECCRWAVDSGLLEDNPFNAHARRVSQDTRRCEEPKEINPFTKEERNDIIAHCAEHAHHSYYAPLLKFLFYTGCRPSEALGLRWPSVAEKTLTFCNSYVLKKDTESLKTQRQRRITLNHQIETALQEQRQLHNDPLFVFKTRKGHRINWSSFTNHTWRKLFVDLPHILYRPPYQMRHTFITLMLLSGESLTDIAKMCGNSPKTILDRYAGYTRDYVPPEL